MTQSIIDYFTYNRSWNDGVKLYAQHGRNRAFLRKINIQGETPSNFEMLHYQLWSLTGKPEGEMIILMMQPVSQLSQHTATKISSKPPSAKSHIEPPKPQSIQEATRIKLREEFPFLKSENCPNILKILVSDMLTAYDNYVSAHSDLYNVTNEQDSFTVADRLISNYLENREIWEELNHYKQTGKVLGKHAVFQADKRRTELIKMNVPKLIKLRENLEMNIWRNKKKLEDDPKPHLVKQRKKRIEEYEFDLKVVKGLLNINE